MSPDIAKQAALSFPRMGTYLSMSTTEPSPLCAGIALYAWNAQVAAAFMYPLHFCEVLVRNAVAEVLTTTYGPQWPWDNGFFLSLPNPSSPSAFKPRNAVLAARKKAEDFAGVGTPSTDKAIAEMSFAFWQSMFTARYDHGLWTNHLKTVFPNSPRNVANHKIRAKIHQSLESIRKLRNRIAHHEPIFARPLAHDYSSILRLIEFRCKQTSRWMDETQTVTQILSVRP
ncbi:Abi family protein [Pseudomonas sp. nanlin1]|uniref:Abi family protein n=1 Tax=Pseudomonas sp. nanlin1 TaxID=3040605 RepID=UPI003890529E